MSKPLENEYLHSDTTQTLNSSQNENEVQTQERSVGIDGLTLDSAAGHSYHHETILCDENGHHHDNGLNGHQQGSSWYPGNAHQAENGHQYGNSRYHENGYQNHQNGHGQYENGYQHSRLTKSDELYWKTLEIEQITLDHARRLWDRHVQQTRQDAVWIFTSTHLMLQICFCLGAMLSQLVNFVSWDTRASAY